MTAGSNQSTACFLIRHTDKNHLITSFLLTFAFDSFNNSLPVICEETMTARQQYLVKGHKGLHDQHGISVMIKFYQLDTDLRKT